MQKDQRHQKILTISIAAYNSEKYLVKCLDSLTKCKTIDKLEVFVINDGSTDSTQMIAEQYQMNYPGSITVVNKENGGHGSTINCSINLATGKYFKIVDADDWVDADGMDRVVAYLEKTSADLVMNSLTYVNVKGEITQHRPCIKPGSGLEYGKEYAFESVQNAVNYKTHMIIFRTDVVKQIHKPISEHCYYVDKEYILYPLRHVHTVVFLDYPIYRYLYGTPDQSVNAQNTIRRRNEHLHVTDNMIQFYYLCRDNGVSVIKLIHDLVVEAVCIQYSLYFKMNNRKAGKEEAIQFDRYLKENSKDLYDDVLTQGRSNTAKLLKLQRKTNCKGYGPIVAILHAFGLGINAKDGTETV